MSEIIVLTGTSSSGKTTLARAIQDRAPRVFLNFSIDNVLYALPERILRKLMTGSAAPEARLADLHAAYYGCIRQLLAFEHSLISDNAITHRAQAEKLIEAVSGHDVLIVGVECSVETAEAREAQRGDRRTGLARTQASSIHRWLDYDLMINTDTTPADVAADQVLQAVASTNLALLRTRERLKASAD